MEIREYRKEDNIQLFNLMEREGEEWAEYYGAENQEKYLVAISHSITHVLHENGLLCGYIRCKEDDGFGVYILDLLVNKEHRGREFGRQLIQSVKNVFPNEPVYVMSDVDPYYEKLGFKKVGSVLEVVL